MLCIEDQSELVIQPSNYQPDYMQWYAHVTHSHVQNLIHRSSFIAHRSSQSSAYMDTPEQVSHFFYSYISMIYSFHFIMLIHLLFKYNILHVHWI